MFGKVKKLKRLNHKDTKDSREKASIYRFATSCLRGKKADRQSKVGNLRTALRVAWLAIFSLALTCCSPSGPRADYAREMVEMYRSMKAGDWAFYRLTGNFGVWLQVTEADGGHVVIKRHAYIAGLPAAGGFSLEYRFDDIERNLLAGKNITGKIDIKVPERSSAEVEAAGRVYRCTAYRVETTGGKIVTYRSDEVALDGVVIVKRNGRVIRSLIATGRAGEPLPKRIIPPRSRQTQASREVPPPIF